MPKMTSEQKQTAAIIVVIAFAATAVAVAAGLVIWIFWNIAGYVL